MKLWNNVVKQEKSKLVLISLQLNKRMFYTQFVSKYCFHIDSVNIRAIVSSKIRDNESFLHVNILKNWKFKLFDKNK